MNEAHLYAACEQADTALACTIPRNAIQREYSPSRKCIHKPHCSMLVLNYLDSNLLFNTKSTWCYFISFKSSFSALNTVNYFLDVVPLFAEDTIFVIM